CSRSALAAFTRRDVGVGVGGTINGGRVLQSPSKLACAQAVHTCRYVASRGRVAVDNRVHNPRKSSQTAGQTIAAARCAWATRSMSNTRGRAVTSERRFKLPPTQSRVAAKDGLMTHHITATPTDLTTRRRRWPAPRPLTL